MTLALTGSAAAAGKTTVRVLYVIPNRINEAQPN